MAKKQDKPLHGLHYNWSDNMVSILCPYCLKKDDKIDIILSEEPKTCWFCHHTFMLVQYVVEIEPE